MPQRTASNHADEKSRAGTAAAIPGGPFLFFSVRGEGVPPRVAILHNVSLCAFVMVLCVQCVRTISHVRWPFVWLAACVYLFLWCGRGACVARRCIQKENIENRLSTRSTHVHACTYNGKRRASLRLRLSALLYHQPRHIRASPAPLYSSLPATAAHNRATGRVWSAGATAAAVGWLIMASPGLASPGRSLPG